MHIWAAWHAWSQLCLGGPVSMPEAGHVCRDFASCQAFPIQLMCEGAEHMPEGRSSSGCSVGFMQSWLEDLWEREWQCHFCLWVCTATPGQSGLIDFTLGISNPTSQLSQEGLRYEKSFPVHYRYLAPQKRVQGSFSGRHSNLIQWHGELRVGRIPLTPEVFWQRRRRIISPEQFGGSRCYSFHLSWILP